MIDRTIITVLRLRGRNAGVLIIGNPQFRVRGAGRFFFFLDRFFRLVGSLGNPRSSIVLGAHVANTCDSTFDLQPSTFFSGRTSSSSTLPLASSSLRRRCSREALLSSRHRRPLREPEVHRERNSSASHRPLEPIGRRARETESPPTLADTCCRPIALDPATHFLSTLETLERSIDG